MDKIKACFFDLDGTLLNSEKQISFKTKEALIECRNRGIQVYIATARPKTLDKMLPGWTKETFELFDGGVYCNGACRCIHEQIDYTCIEGSAVQKTVLCVEQFENIHLVLQMKDEVHAFNYEFDETHIEEWGLQERKIVELSDSCLNQTVKIMIYTCNMVDRIGKLPYELYEMLEEKIGNISNLYCTDQGEVFMVMPKNVSKLSAIEMICERNGWTLDEIAVFGDDTNDMEMLKAVKHSTAMFNGEESVKKIARYVTKSNDEDGVVYALKEILRII